MTFPQFPSQSLAVFADFSLALGEIKDANAIPVSHGWQEGRRDKEMVGKKWGVATSW